MDLAQHLNAACEISTISLYCTRSVYFVFLWLVPHPNLTVTNIWIHGTYYTQSFRKNLPYCRRMFLRL